MRGSKPAGFSAVGERAAASPNLTPSERSVDTCLLRQQARAANIGGRRPGAGDIVLSPPTNEVRLRVALAEAKASQRCCLRHSMPAGAASRYALGAGGVGAVRPAPAASLISASRYALGARRTALRAEGAARLCAGRRSRWLPSPPRATRSAPMAWALRARAPAAAQSRPRAARSAPMARALRARAPACAPADNARVASWWWGC